MEDSRWKKTWKETGSESQVEGLPAIRGKMFPGMRIREKEKMSVNVGKLIFIKVPIIIGRKKNRRLVSQRLEYGGKH